MSLMVSERRKEGREGWLEEGRKEGRKKGVFYCIIFSSYPFNIVTYYIKWVTTSLTVDIN